MAKLVKLALALVLAFAFVGCGDDDSDGDGGTDTDTDTDSDTDTDTDSDTDTDTDTDTDADGDYWVDGYCPEYTDPPVAASDDCNGVSWEGCCDGDGNVIYCDGDDLYCNACASITEAPYCGWLETGAYYWCQATETGEDPDGEFPMECPGTDTDTDTDTDADGGTPDGGTPDAGADAGN